MVFFAQLQSAFSRLVYYGVLPYLAFGPFAVQLQDSIFRRCNGFRPQLTLVTPGIRPQRGRSLTLVGIEVLVVGADLHNELWIEYFNGCCLFMPRLQCHVFGFEPLMWDKELHTI